MANKDVIGLAKRFVDFVNRSPSPFHAVEEVKSRLRTAGFIELSETTHWSIKPLDKCFVVKNQSTIIAFAVGGNYQQGNGFTVIGAHTDSPCLKLKPTSKQTRYGYLQCAVQTYGGGIWLTWFDRDLKLAGRVIVKRGDSNRLESLLVHVDKPILRIPNIAIHLHREINEQFNLNKHTHLLPILGTTFSWEQQAKAEEQKSKTSTTNSGWNQTDKHHDALIGLLCTELGVSADEIVDLEICLADTQPATIGGVFNEFVFAPRIDNLLNSFAACDALVNSLEQAAFKSDPNVRIIALFDNEEVGSESAQGAASLFVESTLRRICYASHDVHATASANPCLFEETIARSILLSADQAHAVHPNYAEKHDDTDRPELHHGIVLKVNANQRYATTAVTAAVVRLCAQHAGVALQDFAVRNDTMCGSTIGPILAARLGIATCDVGAPQLSMHSIRETCCTSGVDHAVRLYEAIFEHFPSVFESSRFV